MSMNGQPLQCQIANKWLFSFQIMTVLSITKCAGALLRMILK